jgi:hypothetical protein
MEEPTKDLNTLTALNAMCDFFDWGVCSEMSLKERDISLSKDFLWKLCSLLGLLAESSSMSILIIIDSLAVCFTIGEFEVS